MSWLPRFKTLGLLLIAFLLALGCLPSGWISKLTPSPATPLSLSPTPTAFPSRTPSPTLLPSPSPTSTPYPVARAGTPAPRIAKPISVDALKQMVHLARWGEGRATKLTWSPDGSRIALGSSAGVLFFEPNEGHLISSMATDGMVSSVAFSPDGSQMALGLGNGQIQMWDTQEGNLLRTISTATDMVKEVVFSPDGKSLLSIGSEGTAQVWDVATGKEAQMMKYHASLTNGRFLSGGEVVIAGTFDGGLVAWRVEDGSLISDLSQGRAPVIVDTTPDGSLIALNSGSKARLLRASDFSLVAEFDLQVGNIPVTLAVLDPQGQYLAAAGSDTLMIYSLKEGKLVGSSAFRDITVEDVRFSPRGDRFAMLLADSRISIIGVPAMSIRGEAYGPAGSITTIAFSPDGRFLGAGCFTGRAQLWQIDTGLLLRLPKAHQGEAVWDIAFSPDSARFLTGSANPVIQAWATATGEGLEAFEFQGKTAYGLAISPDGRFLALAQPTGDVEVLLASDWKRMVYNYRHQFAPAFTVAFSPTDPQILASGGNDGVVRLADVERRQMIHSFQHHAPVYRVAFSPNGQLLATGLGDGSIYIWRIADETPLEAFIAHTYTVTGLSFGPDNRYLVSASPGETQVRFWEAPPSGATSSLLYVAQIKRPLRVLDHPSPAYDVAFNPNGTLLAVGLEDGTLWIWGIP